MNMNASTRVVDSDTTVQTLADKNNGRILLTVYNASTAALYLRLGGTASNAIFTVKIPADGYYEVPKGFNGAVTGVWASVNGFAAVTEA